MRYLRVEEIGLEELPPAMHPLPSSHDIPVADLRGPDELQGVPAEALDLPALIWDMDDCCYKDLQNGEVTEQEEEYDPPFFPSQTAGDFLAGLSPQARKANQVLRVIDAPRYLSPVELLTAARRVVDGQVFNLPPYLWAEMASWNKVDQYRLSRALVIDELIPALNACAARFTKKKVFFNAFTIELTAQGICRDQQRFKLSLAYMGGEEDEQGMLELEFVVGSQDNNPTITTPLLQDGNRAIYDVARRWQARRFCLDCQHRASEERLARLAEKLIKKGKG